MPKLLRIFLPLVLASLAIVAIAGATGPAAPTQNAGGWAKPHIEGVDAPGLNEFGFIPAQRTTNMIWVQTIVGGPDWIGTRAGQSGDASDWAFTNVDGTDYAIEAEYNNLRFLKTSEEGSCYNPMLARPAALGGTCAAVVGDMLCQGSQGDIVVHGNILVRAHETAHNIPNGDLTRSCMLGGNENQRINLGGFDADGDSFTLTQNGQTTIPITRGQNNTTAGIAAALQGGNEQQQIAMTGYDNNGDSFTLTHGANTTAPFVRGTNYSSNAVRDALQGINELQTVSLTDFNVDGNSYTLNYNGNNTVPIVRGQNNTVAGVQNALQGGNEVQTITLTGFNPASANFQLRFNGGFSTSAVIGAGGQAYTAANIDAALNGLTPFAGTATTSALTNGGFTVTFSGAAANTNIPAIEVVNFLGCSCTVANRESARGGAAVTGWPAGGTATVAGLSDTGYTVTFAGAHQGTNVSALSVTNGTGTPAAAGTVVETTNGTAGILPAGTQAAVGTANDAGFTVTFSGTAALTDVAPLTFTNPVDTGGAAATAGSVRETVKGTAGRSGWTTGGTATISALTDTTFSVVFAGTLAGVNVAPLTVTNPTGGVTSLVEELVPGSTGVSFRGMTVIDISDPANPREIKGIPICGNTHTITKYYDDVSNKLFVFGNSGTSGTNQPQFGLNSCGNNGGFDHPSGDGFEEVVEIPLDHPENSRLRPDLRFPVGGAGNCHDVNTFEELHFMATACSGGSNAQRIDLTHVNTPGAAGPVWNPAFTWPGLQTVHSAAISWSGKYIYINGEPGGGSGGECSFIDDTNKPLIHILNATNGKLIGQWALPRPQQDNAQENCTSHTTSLIPSLDRNLMAWSGYMAGISVIDFTNPRAPREIAFVDPVWTGATSGAGCWTGYWYNDKLFCNELLYGAHVFTVDEPWWKQAMTFDDLNPQTNTKLIRCQVSFTGGPTKAKKAANVTATVKVFGPADLQAAWGATVEVRAPGYFKSVKTGEDGTVTITGVKSTGKGKLTVTAPNMENMIGCSAPAKNIAKAAKAKKAKKSTKAVKAKK